MLPSRIVTLYLKPIATLYASFQPRSDLVVGYVKPDGTGVVEDRWAGAYAPPLADASQGCNSIDIFFIP